MSPHLSSPSSTVSPPAHRADRAASGPRRSGSRRTADPDASDRRRAWSTVPLGLGGSSSPSGDVGPAVDIEVWVRHVQLQRTGDPDVLAVLVDEYLGYATSIAHRLVRHGEPLEDIQQVALEALVSSLHRFDVDRGLPFPAFARPTISGAIKRHYRDRGWSIRTPRSVHDIAAPLRDAEERLTAELGRSPRRAEVAEAIGVPETAVRRADQAIHCRAATSLDQPGPDGGAPRGEVLGGVDPRLTNADERIDLRDAMTHLSDRDRALINLYYVDELSQREIGRRYGVSQMQISRWLSRCVGNLRTRVAEEVA